VNPGFPMTRWFDVPIPRFPAVRHFIALRQQQSYTFDEKTFSGFFRRVVFSSSAQSRSDGSSHRRLSFRDGVAVAFHAATASLFSVLLPSDCRICGSALLTVSPLPICQACRGKIVPLDGVLCRCCGEKLFSTHAESEDGPLCGLCRRVQPQFRRAVAYGAYEGELRKLIHLFKYSGIRPAGRLLGRLLYQATQPLGLPRPCLVMPVPLWPGKRQGRGFNQAEAIAKAFLSFHPSDGIELDTSSLVRTRETASQTGLTRRQRRANVRGAFAVRRPENLQGRSILLVDDVMTTGTTAGECARVLRRAGAKEVFVATVARATKEAGLGSVDREDSSLARGTSA
jgi:ComF family protein